MKAFSKKTYSECIKELETEFNNDLSLMANNYGVSADYLQSKISAKED